MSEAEKGAVVCHYWHLDHQGNPVKPLAIPRLGIITKIIYDDGSKEGTEFASGAPLREIRVRFEEGGKDEVVKNQALIMHRRADQTTQFQLKKQENNGLVQDGRGHRPKEDNLSLLAAPHVSQHDLK